MKTARIKKYKEGQLVNYKDKVYIFDKYCDNNLASIFLLEDDTVDLFENYGQLESYEVLTEDLEPYDK